MGSDRVLRSQSTPTRPTKPADASSENINKSKAASSPEGGQEASRRPFLLQCFLSVLIVVITVVSAGACHGNFYGGRSRAHVWWYGWVTCLSSGLGALPVAFFRHIDDWWLGLSNALAAGMMVSASVALLGEGISLDADPRSAYSPLQSSAAGALIGVLFIAISQKARLP